MSSLRRRTSNSGIQWLIIGLILGLGLASVVCVAGYVLKVITIGAPDSLAALSTPTVGPSSTPVVVTSVVVIIATSAPILTLPVSASTAATSAATMAATIVATSQANVAATVTPFVIAAVSSPAIDLTVVAGNNGTGATSAQTTPTSGLVAFPTTGAGAPIGNGLPAAIGTGSATQGSAPNPVASSLTPTELVSLAGATFNMGTTATEANTAVTDCVNRDKGQCVLIDAEDSTPAHQVLVNAFQMERYNVSFNQYLTFLNSLNNADTYKTGCDGQLCVATSLEDKNSIIKLNGFNFQLTNAELFGTDPVTFVTWYGADAYCKAIGRRLPTEAEWERAARSAGGSQFDERVYPWGSSWDPTKANTNRPASQGFTKPVDSYLAGQSADGLYNMAGNAGQWVSDWYDATWYKAGNGNIRYTDPKGVKGPASGQTKVWRGGAWDEVPFFARSVQRQALEPGKTRADLGFRCAADAAPGAALPPAANTSLTIATPAATASTGTTLKP